MNRKREVVVRVAQNHRVAGTLLSIVTGVGPDELNSQLNLPS